MLGLLDRQLPTTWRCAFNRWGGMSRLLTAGEATVTDAPQLKKDVVPSTYRDKYKATGGTCGDFIANELARVGKDGAPALAAVMKENGIPASRWSNHNVGMQRMNLANVLRSTFLNGGDIYILGKQYNLGHMAEDYNGTLDDNDKSIGKFAETIELNNSPRVVKAIRKTVFGAAERARAEEAKTAKRAEAEKAKADKAAAKEAARKEREAKAAKVKAEKAAKPVKDKKPAKAKAEKELETA